MSNFTPSEIEDRIELVKPIVQGAFSVRNPGRTIEPEQLEKDARHWEAALSGVATKHLQALYRIGMKHRCQTAEQFHNVWEMQVNAEIEERNSRAFFKRVEKEKAEAVPVGAMSDAKRRCYEMWIKQGIVSADVLH